MELMIMLIPFLIGAAVAWFFTGNPVFGLVGGAIAVLLSQGIITLGLDWTKLFAMIAGSPAITTTTTVT